MDRDNFEDSFSEMNKLLLEMGPIFKQLKSSYKDMPFHSIPCNKSQNVAIMIIGGAGKITPSALSKHMALEKGSVTTLIDSMVQLGLVCRAPDANDRRKIHLSLTEKGMEQMTAIKEHRKQMMKKMLEMLTEEEMEDLRQSLFTVKRIFESMVERHEKDK